MVFYLAIGTIVFLEIITALNEQIGTVNSKFNTIISPKKTSQKLVTRIKKDYSNVVIGANGHTNFESLSNLFSGVPYASDYALVGMMIQSCSDGNIYIRL